VTVDGPLLVLPVAFRPDILLVQPATILANRDLRQAPRGSTESVSY